MKQSPWSAADQLWRCMDRSRGIKKQLGPAVSANQYQPPGCGPDGAAEIAFQPQRLWRRNSLIVAWLLAGAPVAWAACTLLWRQGALQPHRDLVTIPLMIVPMIATGAFGARRYPEVLPRLILCVIAAAGIALLLAPTPSIPQEGLNHLWVNWTFPYMIVPAVVIGGVMAVVTAKARP